MRYIIILLCLGSFAACNRPNYRAHNRDGMCTAECYEMCSKTCGSEKVVRGKFIGYTSEEYLICECWLDEGKLDIAGKKFDALKKLGVILRKPKVLDKKK